jgi:hypothetical protein
VPQFLPAGEAQLLEFKVDGVGLVTAGTLVVGQEEMRARIGWQRDGACSGCRPSGNLVLLRLLRLRLLLLLLLLRLLLLLLLLLKRPGWCRCVTS